MEENNEKFSRGRKKSAENETVEESQIVSCLRNTKVTIRHINRRKGSIDNPKHVLYGGMAESAKRIYTVPRLSSSGSYKNVLTNAEKDFLEQELQLEKNALSIHKKTDNFWDDANPDGINTVTLTKFDTILDLSDPVDYIKYKILLANSDFIAPSLQVLEDRPKETYEYVCVFEDDDNKADKNRMNTTMRCFAEYGKMENDTATMRTIIEIIEGKPTAPNSKLSFLQTRIYDLIQADSKMFLKIATDELLPMKVLIKKAIDAGVISNRGGFYYMREDNSPLCEHGEDPTLNIAARYLASPRHQELKFKIEATLE